MRARLTPKRTGKATLAIAVVALLSLAWLTLGGATSAGAHPGARAAHRHAALRHHAAARRRHRARARHHRALAHRRHHAAAPPSHHHAAPPPSHPAPPPPSHRAIPHGRHLGWAKNGHGRGPNGQGPPGLMKKQGHMPPGQLKKLGGTNQGHPGANARPHSVSFRGGHSNGTGGIGTPPAGPRVRNPGPGSDNRGGIPSPGSGGTTLGGGVVSSGTVASPAGTPVAGVGVPAPVTPTAQTGRAGRVTTPLAGGTTRIGARRGRTRTAAPTLHHPLPPTKAVPAASFPTVVERFIQFIPWWIWLAFGVAFLGATVAGGAAWRYGRRARAQAAQVALVQADAMTDPLTGVLNRRGFGAAAQRELERAQRYGHPLALAFVDVRGLKTVNDTQGHQAGDMLLRRVADLLRESSRSHDLVGRIGGDELAVILAEQGAAGMAAVVRRVRSQLPATRAALGFDHDWDLTIGMAVFPKDGHSLEALLDAADRRLYMQRGIRLR